MSVWIPSVTVCINVRFQGVICEQWFIIPSLKLPGRKSNLEHFAWWEYNSRFSMASSGVWSSTTCPFNRRHERGKAKFHSSFCPCKQRFCSKCDQESIPPVTCCTSIIIERKSIQDLRCSRREKTTWNPSQPRLSISCLCNTGHFKPVSSSVESDFVAWQGMPVDRHRGMLSIILKWS